jgi:hypothetical protein
MVGASDYKEIVEGFLEQGSKGLAAQTVGDRLKPVLATAAAPSVGRRH